MKRGIACLLVFFCTLVLCASALAETHESALGYYLTYDAELFDCESDGAIDAYHWRAANSNAPACFMSVSVLTGFTMSEAMEGLKLQAGRDGISGSTTLSGILAETFRFYEGNSWNSRVCEYACVPMANGTILLIETDWYVEAEEGIGQKLLDMRSAMVLTMPNAPQIVKCDTCGGWYEEGNVFRNHVCLSQETASTLVATASVNLRTGAGLNFKVVGTVNDGTRLTYRNEISTDERGVTWYRVHYNQRDVWVSSKYAKPSDEMNPPVSDSGIYVVTTASVNLRRGPGLNYDVVSCASASSEFPYISKGTDSRGVVWYKVAYGDDTAWISSEYARIPC